MGLTQAELDRMQYSYCHFFKKDHGSFHVRPCSDKLPVCTECKYRPDESYIGPAILPCPSCGEDLVKPHSVKRVVSVLEIGHAVPGLMLPWGDGKPHIDTLHDDRVWGGQPCSEFDEDALPKVVSHLFCNHCGTDLGVTEHEHMLVSMVEYFNVMGRPDWYRDTTGD